MVKIYSLVSGKGGTGKTTSAINLGAALLSLEEDVIVVDANLSTPNIGLHLGSPLAPITLNHVLNGQAEIAEAIYKHSSGLKIVPSSLSTQLEKIKLDKLSEISKELKKFSENIILDSAAGLGKETEASINAADETILITQAEMPAVTDALKAARLAQQLNKKIKGFIITRFKGKRTEMKIENIKDLLEAPLLGVIPEDKNMQKALFLKNPIIQTHPRSRASNSYLKIARKLTGKEKQGFFSRFFNL